MKHPFRFLVPLTVLSLVLSAGFAFAEPSAPVQSRSSSSQADSSSSSQAGSSSSSQAGSSSSSQADSSSSSQAGSSSSSQAGSSSSSQAGSSSSSQAAGCEHEFTDAHDATCHWQVCAKCGEKTERQPHAGGTATCLAPATCEVCGASYGEKGDHDFSVTSHDGKNHWRECAFCREKTQVEPHAGGTATCLAPAECSVCGAAYGERAPHTGGTATCVQKAVCTVCGTSYGDYAAHAPETEWRSDAQTHWHSCTVCRAKLDEAQHTEDAGSITVQPTANAAGLRVYRCTVCGRQVRTEYVAATGVTSAPSSAAPSSASSAASSSPPPAASSSSADASSSSQPQRAPVQAEGSLSPVILIGAGLLVAAAAVCAVIMAVNLRRR